jgi:hypothetical protein
MQCNKIPYYEKYYHYVKNCLFTPLYLPKILAIEFITNATKSHGGSMAAVPEQILGKTSPQDADPVETQEWLQALDGVIHNEGLNGCATRTACEDVTPLSQCIFN